MSDITPRIANDFLDLPKLSDFGYFSNGRTEGIRFYFETGFVLSIIRNCGAQRYAYADSETYEIAVWPGTREGDERGDNFDMTPMFFESQDQYDDVRGWATEEYIYGVAERISSYIPNELTK